MRQITLTLKSNIEGPVLKVMLCSNLYELTFELYELLVSLYMM